MTHQVEKNKKKERIFQEKPDDIETVFEGLSISLEQSKHLLFLDKLISSIRTNSEIDLVDTTFEIINELKLFR